MSETMGWMPIATAPKDGENILIYQPNGWQNVAMWLHEDIEWWFIDDGKNAPYAVRGPEPTHWMPLPEPPPVRPGDAQRDDQA